MPAKAHRLLRQDLYEMVWAEPMRTLSARFGISDVGLRKVCLKAEIPVPPRGHWAKLRAGKKGTKAALPARSPGMNEEVTLGASRYGDPLWAEDELLGPIPAPPVFDEPIEEVRETVRRRLGKVTVPHDLSKPHPAILRLLEEDEHRHGKVRDARIVFDWEKPRFESALDRRRLRILNGIFLGVSRIGARPSAKAGDSLEIGVSVHNQRVRVTLEPEAGGKKAKRRHGAEPERSRNRLRLAILSGSPGGERLAWEDDDAGKLERRMSEIAAEIVVTAEMQYRESRNHLHEWRIQAKAQLEEDIRRREAEAERKRREDDAALAKGRVDRLLGEAEAYRKANVLRAYVEAVQTKAMTMSPPVDQQILEGWSAWALAQADRVDPVVSGTFLKDVDERGEGG